MFRKFIIISVFFPNILFSQLSNTSYNSLNLNSSSRVLAMGGAILIMLTMPFTNSSAIRSSYFRPLYTKLFWVFAATCLVLMWIGQNVVESPYVEIGQVATVFYFLYFLVIIPFFGKFESYLLRMKLN